MAREDLSGPLGRTLYCDLTQSWSEVGGGIGTYFRHKRRHILDHTDASHLLIVPGRRDETRVEEGGRAITEYVASPRVPGSPNYRLLLRNGRVRTLLARHDPDLIECQDSYNLPWAAVAHRRARPATALVAAYMTDFPTVYVDRPFSRWFGGAIGGAAKRLCYRYCATLYRHFDAVYALSEHGGAAKLRALGIDPVEVVPLGVELGEFSPAKRDLRLRASLGVGDDEPLLIYAGRIDGEKRPQTVVDAFLRLPDAMRATLVLLGEGPLRESLIEQATGRRLIAPGYVADRGELARWLASADLYVSGMADETFGISIIEAQASGLPVIGIGEGAMLDRVPAPLGRTGPLGDAGAMAANIIEVWNGDHRAMGARARAHVQQFSWDEAMARLFGEVYRGARAVASARAERPVASAVLAGLPVPR